MTIELVLYLIFLGGGGLLFLSGLIPKLQEITQDRKDLEILAIADQLADKDQEVLDKIKIIKEHQKYLKKLNNRLIKIEQDQDKKDQEILDLKTKLNKKRPSNINKIKEKTKEI